MVQCNANILFALEVRYLTVNGLIFENKPGFTERFCFSFNMVECLTCANIFFRRLSPSFA